LAGGGCAGVGTGHCGQTAQAGQTAAGGGLTVAQAAKSTANNNPPQSRKERNERKGCAREIQGSAGRAQGDCMNAFGIENG
jgi:hypothetical protein